MAHALRTTSRRQTSPAIQSIAATPASVVVISVDNFGWIRETYGHVTAENLRRSIERHVRHVVRRSDVIGYISDAEFTILLPRTPREIADNIAKRLEKRLPRAVEVHGLLTQVRTRITVSTDDQRG